MERCPKSYHTVEDLRYRLQLTEQNLQNLDALQNKTSGAVKSNGRSLGSPESGRMRALTMDDLSPEGASENDSISFKPDDKDVIVKLQFGNSGSQTTGVGSNFRKNVQYEVDQYSKLSNASSYEEENENLRGRLQHVRDENSRMVSQNHSLLNQLEAGTHQLRQAQNRIQILSQQLKYSEGQEAKLQSTITQLLAEKDKNTQHINNLQEEVEKSHLQLSSCQHRYDNLEAKLKEICQEMDKTTHLKDKANYDRDKALKTAEQIQQSFEKYQIKMQDKINKTESMESHLMQQLEHLTSEREAIIKDCQKAKQRLHDLQLENKRLADESLMEKERCTKSETSIMELRMQLAKYTQNIANLEGRLQNADNMADDHTQLQQLVSELQGQLQDSQAELDYTRTQMRQLQTLVANQGISMTTKLTAGREKDMSDSVDSGVFSNPNKAYADVITQLSQRLAAKEVELQSLRSSLQGSVPNSPAASPAKATAKTHVEKQLKAALERKTQAEARMMELETSLSQLEEEREALSQEVLALQRRLGQGDEDKSSLQSKLDHRASQVEELQQELSEKIKECTNVNRELRKVKSQLNTVERQLDEKIYEVTQHVSQLSDLEDQLQQASEALDSCRKQLQHEQAAAASTKAANESIKQLHAQQCQELQQQIDMLQQKWQDTNFQNETVEKDLNSAKQNLKSRDNEIAVLRKELERRSVQSESALCELQLKSSTAAEQMRQLEASLVVTKQELQLQMDQLQETKGHYEVQLEQKNAQIESLDLRLRKCMQTLEEKISALSTTEKALSASQADLAESNSRLMALEQAQLLSDKQVATLEHRLNEERAELKQELRKTEHKLNQACQHLEVKDLDIEENNKKLRVLEQEREHLKETLDRFEAEIDEGRGLLKAEHDNCEKLEADLKLTRDQLQEQLLKVRELEKKLMMIEGEEGKAKQMAAQLQTQLSSSQAELHKTRSQAQELEQNLTATQEQFTQRQEQINQLKQTLRQKEDELRSLHCELDEQDTTLKQRQWELQQRAAQVTQLDMMMKEHGSQTEQRLIRLESALKKSQVEASQRAHQVSTLDEQLQQLRSELRERGLELQHAKQIEGKMRSDLLQKEQQLTQLEEKTADMTEQIEKMKGENLQLKQELIFSRDEHKKLSHSVVESRKELSLATRDKERLASQLQDLNNNVDSKEQEYMSLKEELAACRAKEAQAKARAEADTRKLNRQMDILKEQHALEVSELQQTQALITQSQEELSASFKLELDKARSSEEQLRQELHTACQEMGSLRSEVTAGRAMLDQANESLVIKDAEVARLQARVSGLQRSLLQLSSSTSMAKSQLSAVADSFMAPSQSTSISTHSYPHPLPDMDLSAISNAVSVKAQVSRVPDSGNSGVNADHDAISQNIGTSTNFPQSFPLYSTNANDQIAAGSGENVIDSLENMLAEVNRVIWDEEQQKQRDLSVSQGLRGSSSQGQVPNIAATQLPLETKTFRTDGPQTEKAGVSKTKSKVVSDQICKRELEKTQRDKSKIGRTQVEKSKVDKFQKDKTKLDQNKVDSSKGTRTVVSKPKTSKGKPNPLSLDASKKKPASAKGKVASKIAESKGAEPPRLSQSLAQSSDIRDRLKALMGKVTNMTVEQFEPDDDNLNNSAAESDCPEPAMTLVPKQYSPVLLEKSVNVSSAIEHYETSSAGSDPSVLSQTLNFSSTSSHAHDSPGNSTPDYHVHS